MSSPHRRSFSRGCSSLALLALCLLLTDRSRADIATGRQDYVVTVRESQWRDMLNEYIGGTAVKTTMVSYVSFTASSDNQLVIYDSWEDGVDPHPFGTVGAAGAPQTTTMRFTLQHGQTITIAADSANPAGNTAANCTPAGATSSAAACNFDATQTAAPAASTASCVYTCTDVQTAPRSTASIKPDGGDFITSLGGPLTVVHQLYPTGLQTAGGGTETFSLQSIRGFLDFRIPIGASPGTTASEFEYARAFITAFADSTHVTVDNGTTSATVTLNAGQTYSTSNNTGAVGANAFIDETSSGVPNVRLTTGTRISSDHEVAVSIGNAGTGNTTYHTDLEAVLPVRAFGRDFVVPVSQAEAPKSGTPLEYVYLFNPNAVAATVTVYNTASPAGTALTGTGVGTGGTIPANGSVTYQVAASSSTSPSTTRIRADQPIWGLGITDPTTGNYDWSFALVPTRFLQTEYFIPYAPFTGGGTAGGNALFIAPIEDNTTVYFYAPGGTTPVKIDYTGDGTSDCAATPYNCVAATPSYTLRTYSASPAYNPYTNKNSAIKVFGTSSAQTNLQGMRIVATAPIAIVYGEDPDVASNASSIDMGFAIVPPSSLLTEDLLTASLSLNPPSLPTTGTATLTMKAVAGSEGPVTGLTFSIDLNSAFTSGAPTATITNPDNTTYTVLGVADTTTQPLPAGTSRWKFALTSTTLDANQTVTGTFTVTSGASIATTETLYLNDAGIIGGQTFEPTATLVVNKTPLQVTLTGPATLVADNTTTGAYTFTFASTTSTALSGLAITDVLPEGVSYVSASGVGGTVACTTNGATGAVTCTNSGSVSSTSTTAPTIVINVKAASSPASTTVSNQGTASATSTQSALTNTVYTTLTVPVWAFTVTPSSAFNLVPNTAFTYQVCADTNATTSNVVVSTPIPTGFSYVASTFSTSTDGTTFATATPTVMTSSGLVTISTTFASVANGSDACMKFNLLLASSATAGTVYGINSDVTSDQSATAQQSAFLEVTAEANATPPTVTLTTTQNPTKSTTPTFTGTVSDDQASGVASAKIYYCAADCTTSCTAGTTLGTPPYTTFTYSVQPSALATGSYCAKIVATDISTNTTTKTLAFSVDTRAPSVSLATAQNPTNVQTPAFTGSISDNVAVSSATISFCTGACAGTCASNTSTIAAGSYASYSVNAPNLGNGTFCAQVVATDTATNATTQSLTYVVNNVAPVITEAAAANPTASATPSFGGTITYVGSLSAATIKYCDSSCTTCGATTSLLPLLASPATYSATAGTALTASGTYCAVVSATDNAGNTASQQATVLVDLTAPIVTATTPDAITSSTTPAFTGTVTDDEPGVTATIQYCDGTCSATTTCQTAVALNNVASFNTNTAPATPPSPAWTDGAHCAIVVASDDVGHTATQRVDVTVDTSGASITFTVPSPTNDATPTLSGTIVDDTGVSSVLIEITTSDGAGGCTTTDAGGTPAAATGTTGFSFTPTTLEDGSYCVFVTSTNPEGKTTTIERQYLVIDTTPPNLSWSATHTSGSSIAATTTLGGSAIDVGPAGLASVTVSVTDDNGTQSFTPTVAPNGSWSVPSVALAGAVTIAVTATDNAANATTISRTYTVDNTPPSTPTIVVPVSGATVGAGDIVVAGNADAGSLVTVTIGTTTTTATADINGHYSAEVPGPFADGPATITVTATDGVGNVSAPVSEPITIDTSIPSTPTITSPASGSIVPETNITVTGTADPNISVTVTIAGNTVTTTADGSGHYSATVPGPFTDGPQTITVTSTNVAGKTSAPNDESVTVAAVPPAPVVISPTNDSSFPEGGGLTVTGTGEPGSTITVTVGTQPPVTVTVGGDGTFTATIPGPLSGDQTITVTDTNAVGTSPSTVVTVLSGADFAGSSAGTGSTSGGSVVNGGSSAGATAPPATNAFADAHVRGGLGAGCKCSAQHQSFDWSTALFALLLVWRLRPKRKKQ